jgi:hypothetical protein
VVTVGMVPLVPSGEMAPETARPGVGPWIEKIDRTLIVAFLAVTLPSTSLYARPSNVLILKAVAGHAGGSREARGIRWRGMGGHGLRQMWPWARLKLGLG